MNNDNRDDILNSSLNFNFCEVYFNNITIKTVEPLKRIVKNCSQLIFEICDLSVNIGEIMDCCDNLKMILFDYHPGMSTQNNTLQHPFPSVHIASFQYDSNVSIKLVSLMIFTNFLQMVNLEIIRLPMNVYIWFAKFANCCEKMVHCLHLKWRSLEFSDADIVAAITTPVYRHTFF